MRQDFGIECVHYQGRFTATCRMPGAGRGLSYGELTVHDTKSGVQMTLARDEWRPLLKSILQLVKGADNVVAGLPIDPVTRAAWQIPVRNLPMAMARGAIITAYRAELEQLQARYIERAAETTVKINGLRKD